MSRAIEDASESMAERRAAAAGALVNYEDLRRSAAAARRRVLRSLPDLLARLADAVEKAGGVVTFAADAAEANRYVTGLALSRGARLVAKSKSMITEEIGLNAALEAEGIEVVETDLGEWLLQLAGEPPSHIVAPAVHMTHADIARLLHEHGRAEPEGTPEELTAYARARLRERFLAADIGVSGCNFAVAETGTVCLVTNEGNGRMVTSLPPVHVAVMGMERVVDDWDQLDLMMSLLPRAATGQDLSVYTTMVTGPRRPDEVDGPDEFHLVILDNGRSRLLGSEFAEMLSCIRCGACLNVCPVYRRIGGHAYGSVYSGPMGAVLSPLLFGGEACELRLASSLCAACYEVCPVMIPLQDLLLGLRRRDRESATRRERLLWRAWAWAWSRPRWYRFTARLATRAGRYLPSRLVPRWSPGRDVPRPERGRRRASGEGR
jgi:L-lactate dehydrogenase complex protein LldF